MIGPTDVLHPPPVPHFKAFQVFLIYRPKRPSFITPFWLRKLTTNPHSLAGVKYPKLKLYIPELISAG
jgi:hypothetical protein